MNKITLLSFLVLSLNAFASYEDPSSFCAETGVCTERMLAITSNYSKGNTEFSQSPALAVSGACYHLSPAYDSEHEHHGGFVFERREKDLMTAGSFSFFAESDPYQNMSIAEMKEYLARTSSGFVKTIENPGQIELQYATPRSDLHYWFRSSPDGKKIYMIAKQAIEEYLGFIFCDFNVH